MNEYYSEKQGKLYDNKFPSPTGVNYYEFGEAIAIDKEMANSFRPQQGLTIMNKEGQNLKEE